MKVFRIYKEVSNKAQQLSNKLFEVSNKSQEVFNENIEVSNKSREPSNELVLDSLKKARFLKKMRNRAFFTLTISRHH